MAAFAVGELGLAHLHRMREKGRGISQIPEGFGWSS